MSRMIANSFVSYELTPQEEQAGTILSHNQKMVLQNKLCLIAEAKLALTFDPSNIQKFLQEEAELQGQLGILTWLLESSLALEVSLESTSPTNQPVVS
jgi:hypothetical protein